MHTGVRSVGGLIAVQATKLAGREFLRCADRVVSFEAAHRLSDQMGAVLRAHGVGPGDRVAVMLPNVAWWPLTWFAIAKLGAVIVPVNVKYRREDLRHVLTDSGAAVVVCSAEQAGLVTSLRGECPALREVLVPEEDAPAGAVTVAAELAAAGSGAGFEPAEVTAGDLLSLQYTSGTTGFPKACMLTHEYWLHLAQQTAELAGFGPGDVDLTAQPFSYIDPQWNTLSCLRAGIPLVVLPRFSASTFWDDVRRHRVTWFYVVGTIPLFLYGRPESAADRDHCLRDVVCSGIPASLHAAFEKRWGVRWREAYGMTETGLDLMVPADDTASVGTGRIGWPADTKEAKAVDEHGRPVQPGRQGELWVRGTPMMTGYWGRPVETAERIDADGWLHTGDLVVQDEDGAYRLVGRLKDMVRRGGENIAAAEVEAVLVRHPKVQAAAVVAVSDPARGEEVKVFLQLKQGPVDPEEILAFARDRLAAFKVPRYLEFVDTFPFTPSERIAKHLLVHGRTWDTITRQWN